MTKIMIQIPEELLDIAPGYLEKRNRELAPLKDALTRNDWEFITKLCHKIKGTAGGYGFEGLGFIAKSLEMAAKAENVGTCENVLADLQNYLENVQITNEALAP